jgi:hypothetical protein
MPNDIVKIEDYSINTDLIIEQFKQSDNLRGMIDAVNKQLDDLEIALFEIRDLFYLSTAVGVQLDVIGRIFNVERQGLSDEDYRKLIGARASIRTSGEPESIITILKVIDGATFVTYIPAYPAIPAAFYLITDATITQENLNLISPAGVQPAIIESLKFEDDTPIEFEDGNLLYVTKVI